MTAEASAPPGDPEAPPDHLPNNDHLFSLLFGVSALPFGGYFLFHIGSRLSGGGGAFARLELAPIGGSRFRIG